jgi:hypothetical protein
MKLSLKARKEIYCPELSQTELARILSDNSLKIHRTDLSKVFNGTAPNTLTHHRIRARLEQFLTDKEKEMGGEI